MKDHPQRLDFVDPGEGGALVALRVSPGAKSTGLRGSYGETAVKLKIAAPPVDGKANAKVERFLARMVGVASPGVRVAGGNAARDETVFVGAGVMPAREAPLPRPR